jgi:subtilisin family serine protease
LAAFAHFDKQGQKVLQRRPDGSLIPDQEAVPTFGHWHGTHCAAILVGADTDGKARGAAPDAELVVARVLELANEGSVAGITAGLWWLKEQSCDIVSLSLGWPGLHEEWAAPIAALLDTGTVVVAAVGNEFATVGVPKSRSPANYLEIPDNPATGLLIPVGALNRLGSVWDDSGGERVDWSAVTVRRTDGTSRPSIFSGIPPRIVPALVGPGVDIVSAVPGAKYFSISGSSQAAPHVAGLIALTLSQLRMHLPTTRPREAADIVLSSVTDLLPPGIDIRSGAGQIDNNALATILT